MDVLKITAIGAFATVGLGMVCKLGEDALKTFGNNNKLGAKEYANKQAIANTHMLNADEFLKIENRVNDGETTYKIILDSLKNVKTVEEAKAVSAQFTRDSLKNVQKSINKLKR